MARSRRIACTALGGLLLSALVACGTIAGINYAIYGEINFKPQAPSCCAGI